MNLSNFFIFIAITFVLLWFYKNKILDLTSTIILLLTSTPFLLICDFTNLCSKDLLGFNNESFDVLNMNHSEDINDISYFYSLFLPILKFNEPSIIGGINRLIFICFFAFLLKIEVLKKYDFFYLVLLFYPSLIMYTNLGGKENFSMMLLIVLIISLYEKRFSLMIICLTILFLIKINLFYIIFPVVVFIYLYDIKKYKDLKYYGTFLLILFILFPSNIKNKIEYEINWRKFNLKCEDINQDRQSRGDFSCENIKRNDLELKIKAIPNILYNSFRFIMSPMPERITKIQHKIQFTENIILLILLIFISLNAVKIDKLETLKIFLIFLFLITIYGNIFSNPGSAIRWKFPLIMMYLFYLKYRVFHIKV